MINRTLVRTHVVRCLFAFYKDGDKTPFTAQKELLSSFSDTYNLYLLLLALPDELTRYAAQIIEQQRNKAIAMHENYQPKKNFINNRLSKQLFENRALRNRLEDAHLSWNAAFHHIDLIYKELIRSNFYTTYQDLQEPTYEDDKRFWRLFYSEVLPYTDVLDEALEEIEINIGNQSMFLEADTNTVLSFVIKTIKRFREDSLPSQPILEMFDSEAELEFSKKLLQEAINGKDEYMALIDGKLRNWDPERIAYMDRIIMQTALAEVLHFPDIAIEVTINEYIEIAKEYSSESSGAFINGIVDQIIQDLRKNRQILK